MRWVWGLGLCLASLPHATLAACMTPLWSRAHRVGLLVPLAVAWQENRCVPVVGVLLGCWPLLSWRWRACLPVAAFLFLRRHHPLDLWHRLWSRLDTYRLILQESWVAPLGHGWDPLAYPHWMNQHTTWSAPEQLLPSPHSDWLALLFHAGWPTTLLVAGVVAWMLRQVPPPWRWVGLVGLWCSLWQRTVSLPWMPAALAFWLLLARRRG